MPATDGLRNHLAQLEKDRPVPSLASLARDVADVVARLDRLESLILAAGVRTMDRILEEMPPLDMD